MCNVFVYDLQIIFLVTFCWFMTLVQQKCIKQRSYYLLYTIYSIYLKSTWTKRSNLSFFEVYEHLTIQL